MQVDERGQTPGTGPGDERASQLGRAHHEERAKPARPSELIRERLNFVPNPRAAAMRLVDNKEPAAALRLFVRQGILKANSRLPEPAAHRNTKRVPRQAEKLEPIHLGREIEARDPPIARGLRREPADQARLCRHPARR